MINDEVGRHVCIWVVQLQRQPQHTLPSLDPLKKKKSSKQGKSNNQKKKKASAFIHLYIHFFAFLCVWQFQWLIKKKKNET